MMNYNIVNEIYLNNRINCGAKGKSYNYKLIEYIEYSLNKTWSPEQIASRLRLDYKNDKFIKVGFKTIYSCIYKNIIIKGDLKKLRRKGNCYDTACIENFFGYLKTELI